MSSFRYAVIWLTVALGVVIALSLVFDISYIYSMTGIAALVFGGHFVTLDDDYPSGWSNPDGSESFWRSSLFAVFVKLMILVLFVIILIVFPLLAKYGA